MSFNFIYKLKPEEKGTGLMSINMEKTYPGLFRAFDIENDELPDENRVWQIQNPYLYKIDNTIRINDYVFIRDKFSKFYPGKKMTNGFSYLKRHRSSYNYFLPTIYKSNFQVSDTPSIGYYARDCRVQSNMEFGQFIQTLPKGTVIVTMGTKEYIQDFIPPIVEWFHTYDNEVFWKSCSHYFYYRPSDIEDPLPHTLLEAIQSKHRIISPKSKYRKFNDGIDDLLSLIDYDKIFIPYNIAQDCDYLNVDNWRDFMNRIVRNDFSIDYPVNRPTFREWILENL